MSVLTVAAADEISYKFREAGIEVISSSSGEQRKSCAGPPKGGPVACAVRLPRKLHRPSAWELADPVRVGRAQELNRWRPCCD